MIMVSGQDVIRDAAAQTTGVTWVLSDGTTVTGTDIAALDSFDVTDVGRSVVDANGNIVRASVESFFDSLITVIARIETDIRIKSGVLPSLMISDDMWGGFVERITYQLGDVITDPKWQLMANYKAGKKNYAQEEHGFYPLKPNAKVFAEAVPILTPVSFPVDQLYEAVRNESEMQAIVNGMRAAVTNTVTLGIDAVKRMLIQAAIAVTVASTHHAINLLALYQAETGDTSVTINNWQASEPFMAFSFKTIAETMDNMEDLSVNFNDGSTPIFSQGSDRKVILLNKFAKIAKFGVRANTYNEQLLGIGDYDTVTSWQGFNDGVGSDYDFASVSKVMVAADPNNKLGIGTSAFTHTGTVALIFDRYALGINPYKRKVTSQYTAIGDYYNEFHHTLMGTILDKAYPMVSFYIAAP